MQTLFQVNQEVVVSSYTIDFDATKNRLICDVTGIDITTGQDSTKSSLVAIKAEDTVQTPAGRPRGKFFKKAKVPNSSSKHGLTPKPDIEGAGKLTKMGKKAV
ncbi:hypothetical protein DFH28DRAFT_1124454 [Melampsora americana]|nr:hypothetical protein DFH28DRAFT_1124454 [Melampsora americana]